MRDLLHLGRPRVGIGFSRRRLYRLNTFGMHGGGEALGNPQANPPAPSIPSQARDRLEEVDGEMSDLVCQQDGDEARVRTPVICTRPPETGETGADALD